jgi:hypothetical protein
MAKRALWNKGAYFISSMKQRGNACAIWLLPHSLFHFLQDSRLLDGAIHFQRRSSLYLNLSGNALIDIPRSVLY